MKQLHIDNETNRVILVSNKARKSLFLGPKRVTVVEYVGPFIQGLDSAACINLVCNTDTLKFTPGFASEANKARLTAWHAAYVSFYAQVDVINKDYTAPLNAEQTDARAERIKAVRDTLHAKLGLV